MKRNALFFDPTPQELTWQSRNLSRYGKPIRVLLKSVSIAGAIWTVYLERRTGIQSQCWALPAPEEYFIISDETAKKIVTQYAWSPLTLNPLSIDKPTTPSIADSFFSANDFMESKDFMREHTKQSSFSKGRIILSPSTKIFYFDLQNLWLLPLRPPWLFHSIGDTLATWSGRNESTAFSCSCSL